VDFGRKPAPLRQLIFGVDDRPVQEIGKPFGLCTWDDQLLVCDTQHRVVHVFDFGAREMVPLGGEGPVQLVKPVDVECDEDGFRYVADAARGEVVVFDTAGRFVRQIGAGTDEDPFKPVALAIGGGKLYAVNSTQHRVETFDLTSGTRLATLGPSSTGEDRLLFPAGIALDGKGRMYVSDLMNSRVGVFSSAGEPLLNIGRPGDRPGDLAKPKHLAFDNESRVLFVADAGFQQVHMFDPQGNILMLFGGKADSPDAMPLPAGICLDRQLLPYFADLIPDTFEVSCLVFVSNQYSRPAILVYAFGRFVEHD
jgi:DNA-binding beta-propeller fold protein YncE